MSHVIEPDIFKGSYLYPIAAKTTMVITTDEESVLCGCKDESTLLWVSEPSVLFSMYNRLRAQYPALKHIAIIDDNDKVLSLATHGSISKLTWN